MNVRQSLQRTRERTRQVWKRSLSRVTSKLCPLNPWSVNPGIAAYVAVAAVTGMYWCVGSIRVWSVVRPYSVPVPVGAAVSSGTVVAVSVGLTAIPLALAIVLGQMYGGRAGRLRVFLHVSGVQLSLVATVTTGIVAAALGGQFHSWVTLVGLGGIAFLACSPILKVLNLLQHQEQFVETWKGFITSRQRIIASQSARRQEAAATAEVTISGWGNDVKIEDRFFERFHGDDLSSYVRVPAGNVGQVDAVDLSSLQRLLDVLRKQAALQASKNSSVLMHIDSPSSTTLITSSGESHSPQPLLIICCLPGSTVDDRERGLAFLRADVLLDSDQRRTMARTLRRAFRIDNSERISETITDLQSETVELCDDLKKGIRSNDRQLVEQFRQMSLSIVEAAGTIGGLDIPGTVHDDYVYRVEALARATDDARCLVENPATQVDREIKNMVLSLPRNLAYAAAGTGNPEVFQRCLSTLWLQCRDSLQEQPDAPDTRHCLSWYGVLSSAIQRLTEPNAARKTDIDQAVFEARLLLQNLSTLLLLFARQQKWNAADLVAEEISNLETRPSPRHNDAVTSGDYSMRFRILASLAYFGLHACLVDLAMAEPPIPVPPGLIEATWPNDDFDLPRLLNVYAQTTAQGSGDAWSWGWEPPQPLLKAYFIRTDEVLAYGFVAIALTLPESALFQDPSDWLADQVQKLEQAAGGSRELEHLLGAGNLVDKILKDNDKITKLAVIIGQQRHAGDRSVDALRRLLKYVQDMIESNKRAGIRKAIVSQNVITDFTTSLLKQYEANEEKEVYTLEDLDLLSTGPALSDMAEGPRSLGVNTVIDKQWFIASESDSWSGIAEEYANGLRKMQMGFAITRLSKIGTVTDLASILAPDSPLQTSTGVLLVDTDVEWLPAELQALVEDSVSPKSGHSTPDAYLRVAGQRLPVYRVWIEGAVKPMMLFIERCNTAHVIRVPWSPEDNWVFSKFNEIKVYLHVFPQDLAAMNELLVKSPAWLEEKGDEKVAYLEELVWLEAYQQLAFDPGATPGVLRLDLPTDEPDAPPQTKDELSP